MRIVLFGASGMVGQGALLACLKASDVTEIIVVGRQSLRGYDDPRIKVVVVPDLKTFDASDAVFANVDACFFCIGVTSFRMSEADYRVVTYDLTLHIAQQLVARSPGMAMVYVSGAGADSSERGKTMWARVRGQTENALQRLPFGRVAIFRPAAIVPEDGIQSRTASYRWLYLVFKPVLALVRSVSPSSVLTTRVMGNAMLNVVRRGAPAAILAPADIYRLSLGQT
ncbi:Rossmann-fold NAD(P)-binding domain-containing protein [Pandoraea norimbergensis]|uniref:Semialdehyde dehydrogenase n=1 Tax=Pandoraea norimbergensis TaxID=93219 RepID=A0ABN4JJ36_9BURK|nr:semialdehyde dehydrogenase [Pandoraea norimbergensis]ALS60274.1 semialdehyde dehydrogenase [Pandoraea norimbergensis]